MHSLARRRAHELLAALCEFDVAYIVQATNAVTRRKDSQTLKSKLKYADIVYVSVFHLHVFVFISSMFYV